MPLPPLQIVFQAMLLGLLGTQEILVLLVIVAVIVIIAAALSKKSGTNSPDQIVYPPARQDSTHQTVVVINEGKSVGLAFLLAFLFGPLGLLYASVSGGLIMIFLSIFVAFVTLGAGLIVTWIVCMVWAVMAASNSKQTSTSVITNTTPNNPTPQSDSTQSSSGRTDRESLLNQLSQLHALKEKGVLTEEIYEQERRRILDSLSKAPQ